MPRKAPKVLLFDLGGVIVRWRGVEEMMRLAALDRAETITRFESSKTCKAFEIGACTSDEFLAEVIDIYALELTSAQMHDLWVSWVSTAYMDALGALETLAMDYHLACLSNTNALHWAYLSEQTQFLAPFMHRFASHLMGTAKPERKSYDIPITQLTAQLDVEPMEILFFDDTLLNVEHARASGLTAVHVDRKVGVYPKLCAMGLISPSPKD